MWTKRQLMSEAFTEIGVASYEFDLTAEEQITALRRLEMLMGTWEARGVRIGYAFASSPDEADPDTPSGIPDSANETVALNLAKRIAPGFGKQLSAETIKSAREGYDALLWAAAYPQQQQLPATMPYGAGNKPWRMTDRQFYNGPNLDPLQIAPGGDLDIPE